MAWSATFYTVRALLLVTLEHMGLALFCYHRNFAVGWNDHEGGIVSSSDFNKRTISWSRESDCSIVCNNNNGKAMKESTVVVNLERLFCSKFDRSLLKKQRCLSRWIEGMGGVYLNAGNRFPLWDRVEQIMFLSKWNEMLGVLATVAFPLFSLQYCRLSITRK